MPSARGWGLVSAVEVGALRGKQCLGGRGMKGPTRTGQCSGGSGDPGAWGLGGAAGAVGGCRGCGRPNCITSFDLGEGFDMGEQDPEEIEDAKAFAQYDQEKAAGTLRTVPHEEVRERLGMTPSPFKGLRLALGQLPDDTEILIEDTAGCKYKLREVNGVLDVSLKDGANSTTLHLVIEEVRADLAGSGWQGGTS